MNKYEEKRQARIDRLNEAADKAEKRASDTYDSARKMSEAIPLGQPIIVGHHSERSDRNYRERIDDKFESAFREQSKADELRAKAEAVENNTAISSDDPEAIQKLKDKILGLEESQEKMKAINKYYKKNGTCIGCDGISDEKAEKLDNAAKKNYEGRPFPTYTLTNNNQNIRSIKLRIKELEKLRELDFEPVEFETGKVIVNKEINRIQFFFDEKPDEETRGVLKSWGFHFSRYNNNAWQRQLNSNGIYATKKVLEKLDEINQSEEQDIDEGPTLGM